MKTMTIIYKTQKMKYYTEKTIAVFQENIDIDKYIDCFIDWSYSEISTTNEIFIEIDGPKIIETYSMTGNPVEWDMMSEWDKGSKVFDFIKNHILVIDDYYFNDEKKAG